MPSDVTTSAPSPVSTPVKNRPAPATRLERETNGVASADAAASHTPAKRGSRIWSVLFFLIVAAAGAAGWYYQEKWLPQVKKLLTRQEAPSGPPPARVVPVVAATAVKRDMKLYLNGLGTVTPLKTVVIRSRVEGELINVHFTEGQLVKEGDLLAEIDPRPFETQRDQAAGQIARDEATLKTAKITLERLQFLAKSEAVATQDVDNQIAVVQQTEGMLTTDRAMLANAELQLKYCKIASPINGIIGLRLVDVGNIVRANDPSGLAVVNQVQPIALVFTISQDDIPRVQKRMRGGGDLEVDAYNRDFTVKLASGKLLATDNQVDSTTGTLRLKAIFEQDQPTLFPNQFVNTRLLVEVKKDAIIVPSAAVQRGPSSTFVYVVKPDSTVELRTVQVGPIEGTETAVEKGLTEGEQVVTDGLDKLQPGAKVSLRDPNAKEEPAAKQGGEKPADHTKPSGAGGKSAQ